MGNDWANEDQRSAMQSCVVVGHKFTGRCQCCAWPAQAVYERICKERDALKALLREMLPIIEHIDRQPNEGLQQLIERTRKALDALSEKE
jgi:hypothetical protein